MCIHNFNTTCRTVEAMNSVYCGEYDKIEKCAKSSSDFMGCFLSFFLFLLSFYSCEADHVSRWRLLLHLYFLFWSSGLEGYGCSV